MEVVRSVATGAAVLKKATDALDKRGGVTYIRGMRKASSKTKSHNTQRRASSGRNVSRDAAELEITPEMRAVAAAFGRIGGRLGGPARAAKLTPRRRSEIAREAARARWKAQQKES